MMGWSGMGWYRRPAPDKSPFRSCDGMRGDGCAHFMHRLSRMAIEPRIPSLPERSTQGFTDETGVACNKREAP